MQGIFPESSMSRGIYSQVGEAGRGPGAEMTARDSPAVITPLSEQDGGGYLATVPDLPGCASDGATREEAAHNIGDAITQWIDEARALGREIPEPKALATTD